MPPEEPRVVGPCTQCPGCLAKVPLSGVVADGGRRVLVCTTCGHVTVWHVTTTAIVEQRRPERLRQPLTSDPRDR